MPESVEGASIEHAALASLGVGVVAQDAHGTIVLVNDAAERLIGIPRDQMLGLTSMDPTWQAIHEDGTDFPGEEHPIVVARLTGRVVADTIVGVRRRDGTVAWLSVTATPIEGARDRAGAPAVVAAFSDVSDLVLLRRQAQAAEAMFRMLAEHTTDLVARLESGTERIDWVSPSCQALLGYAPEELIGRTSREFQAPDDLPAWQRLRDAEAAHIPTDSWVHQIPRKDGSRVWVETVSEVLPATKDQPSYRIVRARNIDAQVRAQQELELRARTDALTGLLSRHAGWQQLRSDLDRERRSGDGLAVLFVDLDGFKTVNDERGHQVGDVLLYAIGTRLKATVRDEDYVVRIGGDEILVVLNGVSDLTAALEVAEKVRRAVSLPTAVDGSSVTVTASIGATQSRPGESVVELVHRADRAMYQAKETGKDQVFAIA